MSEAEEMAWRRAAPPPPGMSQLEEVQWRRTMRPPPPSASKTVPEGVPPIGPGLALPADVLSTKYEAEREGWESPASRDPEPTQLRQAHAVITKSYDAMRGRWSAMDQALLVGAQNLAEKRGAEIAEGVPPQRGSSAREEEVLARIAKRTREITQPYQVKWHEEQVLAAAENNHHA